MPEQKSSEEIRAAFLSFFEEKGHTVVPSASLVPQADPTLLFTNAGMNQFKDVFLGTGSRGYTRAADTQKCLRVSGKHNDLEEVGHDTYHHTFFEMLGNWSFGDYFKREAIGWAWELLTERWSLPADRLYATVHEGDEALGLDPDDEAAGFWKSETGIAEDHILFASSKENFWMMGDTGPCGPCSEVHIDLRPDEERQRAPGRALVNQDHPQVMEIWNLVFIQFDAQADGGLKKLDAQHVDTGMGFERVVAVLQGKSSTYDTDLFAPILKKIADQAPRREVKGYDQIEVESEEEREKIRVAMRVVADHIRTLGFAIADGVTPGNTGRAYVIRRIARRAVRYGYQTLGLKEPFLFELIQPLKEKMSAAFPELGKQQSYIERVIRAEEESFLETLGTGIAFFERLTPHVQELAAVEETGTNGALEKAEERLTGDRQTFDFLQKAYGAQQAEAIVKPLSQAAARREVPGEVAFLLHDTYGFPVDLTRLMAREEGLGVDLDRYTALMQEQRDRARAASAFKTGRAESGDWQEISPSPGDSRFVGYDALSVDEAQIRAVRSTGEDGKKRHEVVLDQTPFYAESGGQVGDVGTLRIGDEEVKVLDVQKEEGRIVHRVDRLPEDLDAPVRVVVDAEKRSRTQKHHTATHLLHAVLRDQLGPHVKQKGSLVAPDRLRFDFSHFERVGPEALRAIERQVNEQIQRNIAQQEDRDVPIDEARERGAVALFGEKYGDRVRVITFDPDFSVELCGGTHVMATGEIGLFRFLSEGSVASGVRRVEAVAGPEALRHIGEELGALERVRGRFAGTGRPVDEEVAALQDEVSRLEGELSKLRQGQLADRLDAFIAEGVHVGNVRLVTGRLDGVEMDALRELGQTLKDRLGEGSVGVLGATAPGGEKVYVVATVADDLVSEGELKAGALVGALGKRLGGGGGGRPDLASAGGREPGKLDAALASVADLIREATDS